MGEVLGDVFGLIAKLRTQVGNIKARKKEGVKFKVRSADELSDKLREAAGELGLLIYPVKVEGKGFVVEDGTLAEVNMTLRILATSDGSYIDVMGFGLGADSQDKAGGKAGTYAWKTAMIQTLLAGGAEDTDDTDTPIKGGVKLKTAKPSNEMVRGAFEAAQDEVAYKAAVGLATQMQPADQMAMIEVIKAAKLRCHPVAA